MRLRQFIELLFGAIAYFFVTLRQIINNDDMEKSIIGREKEKMELKKYISDIISKDGIDIDPLIEGY